jgi:hypothetical protein
MRRVDEVAVGETSVENETDVVALGNAEEAVDAARCGGEL